MLGRWFLFPLCQLLGAALGWLFGGQSGALLGVLVGGLLFLAFDSRRLFRLQRWLRAVQQADLQDLSTIPESLQPPATGLWGDLADRMRRLLRSRDRARWDSQSRLDELLAAMQASPNGVVLLDAQGRIEWCNLTAVQHFGFDAQRDLQQYAVNLVREPAFSAYLAAGDFSGDVVIAGRASTPSRPVKLSLHVHAYGEGRRLLLSRDITAVELAEAMRRDFVANVSHEIRTPLTVLAGFVETLQTLQLTEAERSRYLGLMAQQSQRMQTLVSDLLTLSRLEGSPLPGRHEWISVATLLGQCEQEVRALSANLFTQGHKIVFSIDGDADISGVPLELYSALSNLVTNAVRYTPSPGTVQVHWRVLPDGQGEFAVVDSGPGIAPEHLPRLTERFYRVDRSRSRETGGTGLGLAIVKHVAQRHGAELHIQSQLGHGSRFSIVFPASRIRMLHALKVA
jgi:two-component system phosphate regulon sensor histidine kinase PhoR